MLLQPRKYTYKTRQKKRSFNFFTSKNLVYGDFGLKITKPLRLNSRQIFKFTIFLKKSVKKSSTTKRFFWLKAFPHLPLTRKPKGMRMGKGSGKLHIWFSFLPAGMVFLEFKNLRFGRCFYFSKQLSLKLPVSTTLIYKPTKRFTLSRCNFFNLHLT